MRSAQRAFRDVAAPGTLWVHELTKPINAGRLGVVLFFAISGFVIPFSIKLAHRYPVREFLLTRFFRLYPAYWLSIPLGVITTYWLWKIPYPTTSGNPCAACGGGSTTTKPGPPLLWTILRKMAGSP